MQAFSNWGTLVLPQYLSFWTHNNFDETLNNWKYRFYHVVLPSTDADGTANSEDPDQTALLIWVCTVCLDLSDRKLRILRINFLEREQDSSGR